VRMTPLRMPVCTSAVGCAFEKFLRVFVGAGAPVGQ